MKRILIVFLLLLSAILLAQQPLNLTATGGQAFYNVFYASYLDPANPQSQPTLFNVTIQNTSMQNVASYNLRVKLLWNDNLLFDEKFKSKHGLDAGQSINLRSNDLINDTDTQYFYGTDLDFDTIINNNPDFGGVLEDNGYFPDGTYKVEAVCEATGSLQISNTVSVNIMTILNPLALNLIYPGNNLGMQPATLANPYPNFVWVSNLNNFTLEIFELEENAGLDETTIESSEVFFSYSYEGNLTSWAYPQSAPAFEENKIYAWRIKSIIQTPDLGQADVYKKSQFKLFKLPSQSSSGFGASLSGAGSGAGSASGGSSEITNPMLSIIIEFFQQNSVSGAEEAINLLQSGWQPTGNFYLNGNQITNDQLIQLIQKISQGELNINSIQSQ